MSESTNTANTANPTSPVGGTEAIEAAAAALTATGKVADETQGKPDDSLETRDEAARKVNRDLERKLKAAQDKLDQIEAANLTELEKAQKEAKEAKEAAEKATVDALRFRVAAQHGITEEDAELFLHGTDLETLEKQATRLKERTPTSPRPDPSQGATHAAALNGDGLTEALARAVGART